MADSTIEQFDDAKVFDQVMAGRLSADTTLSGAGVDAPVLLRDHPHYKKVLELIEGGSSIQRLRLYDPSDRSPTWSERLEATSLESLLFRLHRGRATGALRLESLTATKSIAIVDGRLVTICSDQEHELLGSYLQRAGLLDAESAATASRRMAETRRTLGSVVLELELVSVDELQQAQIRQCREALIELFEWPTGQALFYADSAARHWRDVLGVSALDAIRAGLAPAQQLSTTQLRPLLAPLFADATGLGLACPLAELVTAIGTNERALLQKAQLGVTANDMIAELEEGGGTSVAQGLRTLYLFTRAGIIQRANGTPIHLACLPPAAIPRWRAGARTTRATDTEIALAAEDAEQRDADPLAEYRRLQQLLQSGKRLLHCYRPIEAAEKLGQAAMVGGSRPSTETLAYYAIALTLSGNPARGREMALQALSQDKHDALAHAAATHAYKALGARDKAETHSQRALLLAETNPHYLREVKVALRLAASEAAREPTHPRLALRTQNVAPWVALGATLVGLFILSNVFRLGENEYFYNGTDVFFYVRRLWLLIAGVAGLAVMRRCSPVAAIRQLRWRLAPAPALVAIAWGALIGFLSPMQRVNGSLPLVTVLTLFHVLSEEIFFRAYLSKALMRTWGDMRLTVTVSGAIFGIYHMTYYSFWYETDLWPRLNWIALIILVAGIPYALLFQRTKSIAAPFLCHGLVNLVMMWHSFTRP